LVTSIAPNQVPQVAGIDNAKLKVFEDYKANLGKIDEAKKDGKEPPRIPSPGIDALKAYIADTDNAAKEKKEPPKLALTTLESDLVILLRQKQAGKDVEPKLEQNLIKLKEWWDKDGRPNYDKDKDPLVDARLYGAKTALL